MALVVAAVVIMIHLWTQQQRFSGARTLEDLRSLEPDQFEELVAHLLEKSGWHAQVAGGTGDEGIDIILHYRGRLAVCQCKRYRGTVSSRVLRELYGAMMHAGAHEAFLVTSGTISQPGEDWAKGKPIHLIDGPELVRWIRRKS
jgi:restriction system protein